MEFFIPHLRDDASAAEAEWQRYFKVTSAPPSSRRVFSMTYLHARSKFLVTVGEPRNEYPQLRGPRGGYIKNAPYRPTARHTGTEVSGIVDAGDLIYVWSYEPFGGWANPSLVGRSEVSSLEYFEGY